MSLLDAHLEQIELCSQTISDLPFPGPRMFTNALLSCADITSLIRDTEAYERALFSLSQPSNQLSLSTSSNRRATTVGQQPRKQSAVAAVLGGDLAESIRQERLRESQLSRKIDGKQKDDIDVEILLLGAEKLCSVYPVAGAQARIAALRQRNTKVMASIERYEELVTEQSAQLARMNKSSGFGARADEPQVDATLKIPSLSLDHDLPLTVEELQQEQDSIAELERKKKALEDRVNSMEKDLGGLMR